MCSFEGYRGLNVASIAIAFAITPVAAKSVQFTADQCRVFRQLRIKDPHCQTHFPSERALTANYSTQQASASSTSGTPDGTSGSPGRSSGSAPGGSPGGSPSGGAGASSGGGPGGNGSSSGDSGGSSGGNRGEESIPPVNVSSPKPPAETEVNKPPERPNVDTKALREAARQVVKFRIETRPPVTRPDRDLSRLISIIGKPGNIGKPGGIMGGLGGNDHGRPATGSPGPSRRN